MVSVFQTFSEVLVHSFEYDSKQLRKFHKVMVRRWFILIGISLLPEMDTVCFKAHYQTRVSLLNIIYIVKEITRENIKVIHGS